MSNDQLVYSRARARRFIMAQLAEHPMGLTQRQLLAEHPMGLTQRQLLDLRRVDSNEEMWVVIDELHGLRLRGRVQVCFPLSSEFVVYQPMARDWLKWARTKQEEEEGHDRDQATTSVHSNG